MGDPMFTQPTLSRRDVVAGVAAIGGGLLPTTSPLLAATATAIPGFSERFADVNGVRLHYFIGGKSSPGVLLHGYAQTRHMWHPTMPPPPPRPTLIVSGLRGARGAGAPPGGVGPKKKWRG